MRRSLLVAGIGFGCAILACALAGLAPDLQPPAVEQGARALAWHVGDRASYELHVRTELCPTGARGAPLAHEVKGLLVVEVAACEEQEVELALRLDDARRSLPFRARFSREGRLLGCDPPAACSAREGELLIEILAQLQWLVPAAAARTWEREEQHATGRYVARYVRGAGGSATKTKLRYLEVAAGCKVVVLRSRTRGEPALSGSWLDSLEGEEELRVGGPLGELRSRTSVRLLRVADATDVLEGALRTPVEDAASEATSTLLPLSAEIEGRLQTLLSAIDAAPRARASERLELRELLRACPELAARVPELLCSEPWQERARSAVLHALEIVASPAAQSALVAVLSDPAQAEGDRLRAVVAAAGLRTASADVVSSLRALAADARAGLAQTGTGDAATLALGSIARGLDDQEPARASKLRGELLLELADADPARAGVLLGALGNCGDAGLAPRIEGQLESPSPIVRAAAAGALGRLGSDVSLDPLCGLLRRESEARVRVAVVRALGRLPATTPAAVRAVTAQLAEERDEDVRLALTRYLGEHIAGRPEVRTALEAVARAAGPEHTRRLAGDALARARNAHSPGEPRGPIR